MSYLLMTLLMLTGSWAVAPAAPRPQGLPLNTIVDGVDRTFARMQDLSADFTQILEDSLNRKRQESGHLYLKRSRMMRWEYRNPEEKLYVSDGKTFHFYVPADRQVNRSAVEDAVDERMPMMFLLGRSGLRNEFSRIVKLSTKPLIAGDEVLQLFPMKAGDIEHIVMEVSPSDFLIHRLALAYSDGSTSEFIFNNIRINTGLDSSLFDFKVPPGVKILEGIGQ